MSAAAITADPTAVKRNPQDILGLQFSQYKQKVYSLSVTNPTEYFAIRVLEFLPFSRVLQNIRLG